MAARGAKLWPLTRPMDRLEQGRSLATLAISSKQPEGPRDQLVVRPVPELVEELDQGYVPELLVVRAVTRQRVLLEVQLPCSELPAVAVAVE